MVSVIIPTYNDTELLPQIVQVVKDSGIVDEIIIVNDGSTKENTAKIHSIKGVKILDHATNLGKATAMKTGFENSRGNVICFLDADINGLRPIDVRQLITPVLNKDYDMTLSKRGGFTIELLWRLIGAGEAVTGERALQRKMIEENMQIFDSQGYSIEVVMNKAFFRKYNIALVVFPYATNKVKIKKVGVREGVKSDINMLKSIFSSVGFKEFILQGLYVKNFDIIKPEKDSTKYKVVNFDKIRGQIIKEISKIKNKTLVLK